MLDSRVAKMKLILACSLIGYTSYLEGGPLCPARKNFFSLTYQAWSVKTAEYSPHSFCPFMNRNETKRKKICQYQVIITQIYREVVRNDEMKYRVLTCIV